MVIIIDDFVTEEARVSLLQQLPPLEEGVTRALPTVLAPLSLERSVHNIVRNRKAKDRLKLPLSFEDEEPLTPLPARLATGSVPMHKDCFNPFDAAEHLPIEDYVAILYLDGSGKLVVDTGQGEQTVDVLPGRFVAWPNGTSYHRFDAPPGGGVRAMVGPIAFDAEGCAQRAHDVWSTHPGYIGACKKEAADAEAKGDHEAAIAALNRIGIPGVAADLVKEYEQRRKAKQMLVVANLSIKPGSCTGEYKLSCDTLGGESIIEIDFSAASTFGSIKPSLMEAVEASSKEKDGVEIVPRFLILSNGIVLEESHEQDRILELFGAEDAGPSS